MHCERRLGLAGDLSRGSGVPWQLPRSNASRCAHPRTATWKARSKVTGGQFFKRVWWLGLLTAARLIVFFRFPLIYARYKAAEWRWWISGVRFGGWARFELEGAELTGLYWKVLGWFVVLGSLFLGPGRRPPSRGDALSSPEAGKESVRIMTKIPLVVVAVTATWRSRSASHRGPALSSPRSVGECSRDRGRATSRPPTMSRRRATRPARSARVCGWTDVGGF